MDHDIPVPPTIRQQQPLDFLESFLAANGYPPTVREICRGLGLSSTQTAYAHLAKLEQKGYLRLNPAHGADAPGTAKASAHRCIRMLRGNASIPSAPLPFVQGSAQADLANVARPDALLFREDRGRASRPTPIPLIGRVAAGQPLLALENVEGYVDLGELGGDAVVFALRVKGDSMIEAGILDGDYVLVRPQPTAEDGDIVVALLHDEATVKFFFREGRRIRLQPANRAMQPILAREVRIAGKVIASLRGYGPGFPVLPAAG